MHDTEPPHSHLHTIRSYRARTHASRRNTQQTDMGIFPIEKHRQYSIVCFFLSCLIQYMYTHICALTSLKHIHTLNWISGIENFGHGRLVLYVDGKTLVQPNKKNLIEFILWLAKGSNGHSDCNRCAQQTLLNLCETEDRNSSSCYGDSQRNNIKVWCLGYVRRELPFSPCNSYFYYYFFLFRSFVFNGILHWCLFKKKKFLCIAD